MAKPMQPLILLASTLIVSSLLSIAHSKDSHFYVEGEVYCDKCRAQFFNRLSEPMPGATVKLECRDPEAGHLTYSNEGKTDGNGRYNIKVDEEHEDEICEVSLVKSGNPDCAEVPQEKFAKVSSRIILTSNSGLADPVRRANPLGFEAKKAVPECYDVYKELNILPPDENDQ